MRSLPLSRCSSVSTIEVPAGTLACSGENRGGSRRGEQVALLYLIMYYYVTIIQQKLRKWRGTFVPNFVSSFCFIMKTTIGGIWLHVVALDCQLSIVLVVEILCCIIVPTMQQTASTRIEKKRMEGCAHTSGLSYKRRRPKKLRIPLRWPQGQRWRCSLTAVGAPAGRGEQL
jgi:hypothetical protein